MFDIGASELVLIAIVALLVIGPERMPGIVRNVGMWMGRAKRFVNEVQSDINRELEKSEDLKRLMEEQSELKDLHKMIEEDVDESRRTVAIGADLEKTQLENKPPAAEAAPAPSASTVSSASSGIAVGAPVAVKTKTSAPGKSSESVNEQTK
jgi:sec-independent protein translocase protein TatB